MKTQTAFQAYESEGKRKIREYKIKKIQQTADPAVFELYGSEGTFHNLVKQNTNAKIISIDCDPKIAKIMEGNPDTYFGTIQNYCKESRSTFNFIDLDYCGTLGENQQNDLRNIHKIMKDEGTLFITVFHGREYYVPQGANRSDIERFHYYIIHDIFAENHLEVEHISSIKYLSLPIYKGKEKRKKKGASAMMVYEYKWKKTKKDIPIFNNRIFTLASNLQ